MKKGQILVTLLSIICTQLTAQNIVGRVIDEKTNTPTEFTNVVLLNSVDSTFIGGTVTDANGQFSLPANDIMNKIIKISHLGYNETLIRLTKNQLGDIKLSPNSKILNELVVEGRVHKLENSGIATNIQGSHLKDLGSALDVLGQLPFVMKSENEIQVFGKGTPIIYINNRLVRDNNVLEELNSSNIKKVTVITNPGAEYKGNINAVIKIETIKLQGDGLSGSSTVNTYFEKRFSHSEIQNLNYRIKNWDIFGMLRYSDSKGLMHQDINQSISYENKHTDVEQQVREEYKFKTIRSNIGFNVTVAENHNLGIKYEYTKSPNNKIFIHSESQVYKNKNLFEELASPSSLKSEENKHYINFYYAGKILPHLSIQFDGDVHIGDTDRNQDITNIREQTNEFISTKSIQDYKLYAGKLKFESPLLGGQTTYGGEYSYTKNKQYYYVNEEGTNHYLENNQNSSNQDLYAVFALYNRQWGKFLLDFGLRYEEIHFNYFGKEGKLKDESKKYRNFLPNAGLTYSGEQFQFMLAYRNTIDLPSYYQMRNSIQYSGPYTYERGNPFLKPTQTNSISLLMIWKGLKVSTMYSMLKNTMLFIPEQYKDDIVVFNPVNVNKSQRFSFALSYSKRVGFWEPSIDMGVSKDFLHYTPTNQDFKDPRYTVYFKNHFNLPVDFQAGLNASYSSKGHSSLSYMYDSSAIGFYLTKHFLNKKLRINISGSDIFNMAQRKRIMDMNNIVALQSQHREQRMFTISATYRFNSTKDKYRGERATREANRL